MRIGMRRALTLAAALVLWTAMAWAWVTVTGNMHVCSILQTISAAGEPTPPPLTQAEMDAWTRERCGPRASFADILIFGTGYLVIIGVAAIRASSPPSRVGDEADA